MPISDLRLQSISIIDENFSIHFHCLLSMIKSFQKIHNSIFFCLFSLSQSRLSQLGKLILQGAFSISYDNKKDGKTIIKDQLSRLKVQQRQVFVFENAVIFCKKRDENTRHGAGGPQTGYTYKSQLQVCMICYKERAKSGNMQKSLNVLVNLPNLFCTLPKEFAKSLWDFVHSLISLWHFHTDCQCILLVAYNILICTVMTHIDIETMHYCVKVRVRLNHVAFKVGSLSEST